jgi:CBS domain-containing protein
MMPAVSVAVDADLRIAAQLMVVNDLRSIPVIDASGSIIAMLDEHDVAAIALGEP